MTRITYLFSADMPHRFSAGSCTAICWRPRGNARIVRRSVQSSTDERGSIRTWMKMGEYQLLNPCSHATAEALSNGQPFCHTHPRIMFNTYVYLWSRNKTCSASQATSRTYVRTWVAITIFRTNPSEFDVLQPCWTVWTIKQLREEGSYRTIFHECGV